LKNLTIYILAGGKSSRMGSDKGLVILNNKPMIEYVLETVKDLSATIKIISSNTEYTKFGFPILSDLIIDKGPVGGIYTALSDSETKTNLIVSCDTPFVSLKLLNLLIKSSKNKEVCIPTFKGKIHPLIGVYSKDCINAFKSAINKDCLKLMTVNNTLNHKIVETQKLIDEKEFTNMNSKSDIVLFS